MSNHRILNAPERIYLQTGIDDEPNGEYEFQDLDEVSWCQERIYNSDLEYVRQDWRLMNTAPLDGTQVLVISSEVSKRFVCVAFWDRDPESEGGQCWREYSPDMERITPLFWMPMPEPPEASE